MKPYYDKDGITIYNGDCLEVMQTLEPNSFDLVLTDPPYPDYYTQEYFYYDGILDFLNNIKCKQIIFWSAKVNFPLDYSAIHIWNKKTGVGSMYERIFERNGQKNYRVFDYYLINSDVAANFTGDIFTGHKSQKPIHLIKNLVKTYTDQNDLILDPFMGSGTTLVAAKKLKRRAVGIELSEQYCQIAVNRLENTLDQRTLF